MNRIRTIDVAKGSLIVLVIVGHALPGEYRASLARWLIYSFHMPLFVAVSGYLFPWEKIATDSFAGVIRKYRRRLLMPWLIALTVYAMVDTVGPLFSMLYWVGFFAHFIRPFFHLWFVAAYMFYVLLSWCFLRMRVPLGWIFIAAIVIAFISELLRHRIAPLTGNDLSLADTFLYTLHPSYFVFFVFGGFLRNYTIGLPVKAILPLTMALLAGEVVLFYYPNERVETVLFFVYNACLIRLLVALIKSRPGIHLPLLEWIGVNSLGIYLWHALPLIFVARVLQVSGLLFYLLDAVLMAGFFLFVRITSRLPVVGRLLYGV
jgi:acyltransferase